MKPYKRGMNSVNNVLQIMARRIRVLIAVTIITVASAVLLYINVTTVRYEASAVILIDNNSEVDGNRTYEDLLASQRLAEYFGIFFYSGVYRDDLTAELKMTGDQYDRLIKNVQVRVKKDTGIVTMTLHNGAKAEAMKSLESISGSMIKKFTALTGVRNVRVIKRIQSEKAMDERLLPFVILCGLLGGLVISTILGVIIEKSGDTVKSADDAAKRFNIPVLGVIPLIKEERSGHDARKAV